jgi:hypothetical protein
MQCLGLHTFTNDTIGQTDGRSSNILAKIFSMRALICSWIVGVGVGIACTGVGLAAPKVDVRQKYKAAAMLVDSGEAEQALGVIEEGLALAPKDLSLLKLKGTVLCASIQR